MKYLKIIDQYGLPEDFDGISVPIPEISGFCNWFALFEDDGKKDTADDKVETVRRVLSDILSLAGKSKFMFVKYATGQELANDKKISFGNDRNDIFGIRVNDSRWLLAIGLPPYGSIVGKYAIFYTSLNPDLIRPFVNTVAEFVEAIFQTAIGLKYGYNSQEEASVENVIRKKSIRGDKQIEKNDSVEESLPLSLISGNGEWKISCGEKVMYTFDNEEDARKVYSYIANDVVAYVNIRWSGRV